jgi:flavin-dependent dehydrogenase
MKHAASSSVADAFASIVEDGNREFNLQDGSRVAVVGGGPAGSFFSYFLCKMAQAVDLDVAVDIYEPRSFGRCGPAGCNHCGGIVSELLVQILAAEGIRLPRGVVQRGIESYVVHMDVGDVEIESPVHEQRIAALYRGNGPREGGDAALASFDEFLQDMATGAGARVVRRLITGVGKEKGLPRLEFADGPARSYDLLAVAAGVNSNFLQCLEGFTGPFEAPRTTRGYICEFRLSEEEILSILGNSVHVFLLDIPRFEFAAIIPKGPFATVVMVGDDIDQELVHEFLTNPVVRSAFPTDTTPCVCSCSPRINLGARQRPYADRLVMVGDAGVTRLYKDGIGAAFRTGKAAATTAVFHGVSANDFESHYWPACKRIVNDNRVGKVMFATNTVMKNAKPARAAILQMARREQSRAGAYPHMSSLLWNMFTGSAPYTEMFRGTFRPGFLLNLARSLPAGLGAIGRRGSAGKRGKDNGKRSAGKTVP